MIWSRTWRGLFHPLDNTWYKISLYTAAVLQLFMLTYNIFARIHRKLTGRYYQWRVKTYSREQGCFLQVQRSLCEKLSCHLVLILRLRMHGILPPLYLCLIAWFLIKYEDNFVLWFYLSRVREANDNNKYTC
jgi:hypothetical protein